MHRLWRHHTADLKAHSFGMRASPIGIAVAGIDQQIDCYAIKIL